MIINTVEPSARDEELGIDVVDESSNHQAEFLELDNLFLGLGFSYFSNDDDEEEVQQQQPSSVSFNEEEIEQQPSSSPNDNEDKEDIPHDRLVRIGSSQPTNQSPLNCPMILKPFAWL